jgi:FlaA1/EpsC-like NDP-sugar epimerase
MQDILSLIGRKSPLFTLDILRYENELFNIISSSRFLIIGAAGSIGQAVTKEIFKREPKVLHAIDINENNLVELVRDLRSSLGYIKGEFKTFAIDCSKPEFEALMESCGGYDYVLNLSALKHVRSEKDPFTLMRLIEVNILNTISTLMKSKTFGASKYFCVSTDKAANPVSLMGASKRIMEMFIMRESQDFNVSLARFANVAFSDGSLLFGFNQRISKKQPISAPNDIRRYFLTPQESGELCLMSCLFGENRDIFFPKLDESIDLIKFSDIADRYLNSFGYKAYKCKSEEEARNLAPELIEKKMWPCYFFSSDTSGEKTYEEFFTSKETLDLDKFDKIGVIKNLAIYDDKKLDNFLNAINQIRSKPTWGKDEIISTFQDLIPDFSHLETGKNLDGKM